MERFECMAGREVNDNEILYNEKKIVFEGKGGIREKSEIKVGSLGFTETLLPSWIVPYL